MLGGARRPGACRRSSRCRRCSRCSPQPACVSLWGSLATRVRRTRPRDTSASRHSPAPTSPAAVFAARVRCLREAPYLRNLAAIVALGAVTSGLLDYVFSAEAARAFSRGPALLVLLLVLLAGRRASSRSSCSCSSAARPREARARRSRSRSCRPSSCWAAPSGSRCLGSGAPSLLRGGGGHAAQLALPRRVRDALHAAVRARRSARPRRSSTSASTDSARWLLRGSSWLALWLAGARAEMVLLVVAMASAVITLARSRALHTGYVIGARGEPASRGRGRGAPCVSSRPSPGRDRAEETDARRRSVVALDVVRASGLAAEQQGGRASLRRARRRSTRPSAT